MGRHRSRKLHWQCTSFVKCSRNMRQLRLLALRPAGCHSAPPLAGPSTVLCCALCVFFCAVQLKELKQELGGLRVAKVTGGAPNKLSKM